MVGTLSRILCRGVPSWQKIYFLQDLVSFLKAKKILQNSYKKFNSCKILARYLARSCKRMHYSCRNVTRSCKKRFNLISFFQDSNVFLRDSCKLWKSCKNLARISLFFQLGVFFITFDLYITSGNFSLTRNLILNYINHWKPSTTV